jgi:O-antigen/teichoic acid export membrane protein
MLPLSALLALGATKIVIGHYGVAAYGIFALILSIPALLPARDLGLGAKVIDVVARRHELGLATVEDTLAGALGRISRVAVCAIIAVIAAQVTVGWSVLLGNTVSGVPDPAITATLCLFALSLPGGLAVSVLWGLRRMDLLALQGPIITLSTCASVGVAAILKLPLWAALVACMAWNCGIQWASLDLVASYLRLSRKRLVANALRPLPQTFRRWAVPMLLISTAGSIAYQTDRLVLSHIGGSLAVAHYSVVAQLFFPLLGIVSSAGYTLWGKYAVERGREGVSRAAFVRTVAVFAGVGLVEAVLLTAAGPFAIEAVLGVRVAAGLCAAFGLLLMLQAAGLPVGMLMTDERGLRDQAIVFSLMVILNVWLSILLAARVGTSGPVLASAITYLGVVLLPSGVWARRYLTKHA